MKEAKPKQVSHADLLDLKIRRDGAARAAIVSMISMSCRSGLTLGEMHAAVDMAWRMKGKSERTIDSERSVKATLSKEISRR